MKTTQRPTIQFAEINLWTKEKRKENSLISNEGTSKQRDIPKKLQPIHKKEPESKTKIQGEVVRLKSQKRVIMMGIILCLCGIMYGISIKEITSVSYTILQVNYSIPLSKSAALSILMGILPIGSILGTIITNFLLKRYPRLTGIYIFSIINVIGIGLVNVNIFAVLVIGRFIEGMAIGYYSIIAPIYLKEISPKQLRKKQGLLYSVGKILGVLLIIGFELILYVVPYQVVWRITLSTTAIIAILQVILVYFFCLPTPIELIQKEQYQQAKKIIAELYKQQYQEEIYNQLIQEVNENRENSQIDKKQLKERKDISYEESNIKIGKTNPQPSKQLSKNGNTVTQEDLLESNVNGGTVSDNINKKKNDILKTDNDQVAQSKQDGLSQEQIFKLKKKTAFRLSVHLSIIRHLTGGNAILSQGGLFIKTFNPDLGKYTSVIINSIQFAFIMLGIFYITNKVKKRPLFLFSVLTLSLLDISIAIVMIFNHYIIALVLMSLYMVVNGGSFISPIWSYPFYIITSEETTIPNICHWLALSFSLVIPPLIGGAMPAGNPYPVFFIFGVYGLLSYIHVVRNLQETDGKNYIDIIKSFKI